MKINPQDKLHDNYFKNNILLLVCIFSIVCFFTVFLYENGSKASTYEYSNLEENTLLGPIKTANKSQIYKIIVTYPRINNFSSYISGEVLDENKNTLYEFGKDLWHESGRDSEGYWQEYDKKMEAFLTFSQKGTYYIQLQTSNNRLPHMKIKLIKTPGSYIPFLIAGVFSLVSVIFLFFTFNKNFISGTFAKIGEALEEDD